MTPEEQRIAIAEACGWTYREVCGGYQSLGWFWCRDEEKLECVPDYPNDLNAMHEAEKVLPVGNQINGSVAYANNMMRICGTHDACVRATAAQRAESMCRTLWPERFEEKV